MSICNWYICYCNSEGEGTVWSYSYFKCIIHINLLSCICQPETKSFDSCNTHQTTLWLTTLLMSLQLDTWCIHCFLISFSKKMSKRQYMVGITVVLVPDCIFFLRKVPDCNYCSLRFVFHIIHALWSAWAWRESTADSADPWQYNANQCREAQEVQAVGYNMPFM
jgi:hypothetical protein